MEVAAEDGDVFVGDDARSRQVTFVELLDLHRLVGVQRHRQRVELTIARAFEQHLKVATRLGVSETVSVLTCMYYISGQWYLYICALYMIVLLEN